ncbi:MAG: adenosylcobinamide-GDP ribazoletransferase [Sphingobium sp.]
MKGFMIALQFLTRLPGPRLTVSDAEFAGSMRWFPAVGLVVGGLIAGALWLGGLVDPWVAALAALTTWLWVTGALHLDGLADVADAAGAAHKGQAQLLAVLRDPHVGSFGAVVIAMQIAAKMVLFHGLAEQHAYVAIIWVPFAARLGPLVWTRLLPPLHDGLGARFREGAGNGTLAVWAVALLVAAWSTPAIILSIPAIFLWKFWIMRTLGGISGDGHGAGIEVVETVMMLGIMTLGEMG